MIVRYIKDVAGISAGVCKDLREDIAQYLIKQGVVEEVKKSAPKKESKPEMETKEEKTVSKRRTKTKK